MLRFVTISREKLFSSYFYFLFSLAELKLAEKDRKQQEKQLREQLLLAGIQDGPSIHYDMSVRNCCATFSLRNSLFCLYLRAFCLWSI